MVGNGTGTVALAMKARHQRDSGHEISPIPSPPTHAELGLRRVPLPARGHHPGGPLVPPVRPVLPGCGGAPRRARARGRSRHGVPVGSAVRTGVRRGRQSPTARYRGSLARGRDVSQGRRDLALPVPGHRPVRPGHRRGATCSGPSTSSARSSTCISHLAATPRQHAGSSGRRSIAPGSHLWRSPALTTGFLAFDTDRGRL